MTYDELYAMLRPVLAAALEAGREYERLPADQRGTALHFGDEAARDESARCCFRSPSQTA